METPEQRIDNTMQAYQHAGWRVDQSDGIVFDYWLFSPTGTAFQSNHLINNNCPFCEEEDEPEGNGQFTCHHSEELLAEEREAKNLLNFIKIRERDTILMCQLF